MINLVATSERLSEITKDIGLIFFVSVFFEPIISDTVITGISVLFALLPATAMWIISIIFAHIYEPNT